jgi:hypothetical protein
MVFGFRHGLHHGGAVSGVRSRYADIVSPSPIMRNRPLAALGLLATIALLPACNATATYTHPPGMANTPGFLDVATTPTATVRDERAEPLPVTASRPCGYRVPEPRYNHVIWVLMENESLSSIIGMPGSPYATQLARRCGLATGYSAITHPSLPNYLALTGGTTFGVTDDGEPSTHPIAGASIFSELGARHLTWRSYAESMPTACDTVTSGLYAARHNPAVYYTAIRSTCAHADVPMGPLKTGALHRALYGTLASFVFVTPNVCDDAHSCPVRQGDQWLSEFFSVVFASPTYRLGHTAVFVVWDEGNLDNVVPAIVVAPSVPDGRRSAAAFNHYSLLRTAEQLLGVPPIANAAKATSMVTAFGL